MVVLKRLATMSNAEASRGWCRYMAEHAPEDHAVWEHISNRPIAWEVNVPSSNESHSIHSMRPITVSVATVWRLIEQGPSLLLLQLDSLALA